MEKTQTQFEKDVIKGLIDYPKHLPSKYIYDQRGDKLFQIIMAMPEYYLTNCEFDILSLHKTEICEAFSNDEGFDLIELGAGDGKKTKILLKELVDKNYNFDYFPIDISQNVLDELTKSLKQEIPEANVYAKQGTYFDVLSELDKYGNRKKVILFLGSNIGNLLHKDAIKFLKKIQRNMQEDDVLFLGFDQKKHPQTILNAYNDDAKITEKFNKNILRRINRQFEADFDLDQFMHWETYNPETGTALSYLVSLKEQNVKIKKLDLQVKFEAWESIHVEISQKYDDAVVEWLAAQSGLKPQKSFLDQKGYYKNYIFKAAKS
ncbi:L-histidine N(alpha)-methyltransferase [Mesohalobacter halotolerans]|uniref:L-histidine N(Alpha)-methyltransferase n=1 Tax=Mesohalobacter halotolerans TaxID=1883405 RepID=A0A4U5TTN9_9FLAO|nr:L-histidine N(alpha)-methyltransferase [Mesohalobacter halotolerans]TKS56854.1 L-histidine N(alpha)-methyltransferase [Mesohalobacter halotolerans]